MTLDSPKSAIFTLPCVSSRTFSGLRSRWTTLCWWQYSTAQMICWKNRRASSSVVRPFLTMWSNNSPPETYSMIMKMSVGVLMTSYLRGAISVRLVFRPRTA